MLYFLISFVLFFSSAQSKDSIDPYFAAITGEFENTPEAIAMLLFSNPPKPKKSWISSSRWF